MRVQQIDLSYTDKAGDTLGGATLHVQSRTLSGQEVYTQVSLEAREVRALEQRCGGAETPDPRTSIDLIRFGRSQKKRAIIQVVSNRLQTGLKISLD